jgi:acetyltransferase-like isoleucine patch superfamily enzyme
MGDLRIEIGENVRVFDRSTFAALTVGENPTLRIGDNSNLSCSTIITVGNEVVIGKNCMIGCKLISDNPGHNVRVEDRGKKLDPERIGRIKIGDHVWAALDSMIIGNVEIGYGSIIAARSVVTKSIPPMSIVAGNPAKVIKRFKQEISEEDSS